jgi:hypothetical protein
MATRAPDSRGENYQLSVTGPVLFGQFLFLEDRGHHLRHGKFITALRDDKNAEWAWREWRDRPSAKPLFYY